MVNLLKTALTTVRKFVESLQGLAIESNALKGRREQGS